VTADLRRARALAAAVPDPELPMLTLGDQSVACAYPGATW
jgi:hypothetical protein